MKVSGLENILVNRVAGVNSVTGGGIINGIDKSKGIMTEGTSFSGILSEAMQNAQQTDTADKISGLELLTGQSDDLSGVMLDVQKAEIALNLTLQIRNKMMDAYKEIMQMQV